MNWDDEFAEVEKLDAEYIELFNQHLKDISEQLRVKRLWLFDNCPHREISDSLFINTPVKKCNYCGKYVE